MRRSGVGRRPGGAAPKPDMRKLFIFFLLVTIGVAKAQVLPIRNYGIREGLNAGSISAVLRDSRGLLWVGTYNGVNLYDGNRFQQPVMGTRSGQIFVNQFFEDRHKNIWIASWYSGLYRYADGVFSNWLPDSVNIGSQSNSVLHLTELPDGRLLCGTDHNVFIFDGHRFMLFDSSNRDLSRQITVMACLANGDILIGLPTGIAWYKKTATGWKFAGNFWNGIEVNSLLVAGNQLWAGTSKGLFYFSSVADRFAGASPAVLVPEPVGSVFVDASRTLWYTTSGSGIWRLRPGNSPEHLTRDNGLPSSNILCSCTDVEGIVWLGTDNGLAKLTPAGYRFFPVREGEENANIIALAKDEKQWLWAGSYGNIFRFDGPAAKEEHTPEGKAYGFVSAMLTDGLQRLWLCTSTGLYCIENGIARLRNPALFNCIMEDSTGILWLGGQDGQVSYLENGQFHQPGLQARSNERITGITRDGDGNLWIGYASSGLRKLRWQHDSLLLIRSWSPANGYPRFLVRRLRDDHRGHLLVGTRTGGLFIIPRDSDPVLNITQEQGLSGNWIKDIRIGGNRVFLATNNGLDVLEVGAYRSPARHIGFNDDRVPVEFNTALLRSDTLWLGTSRGILEYSLHGQRPDSLAPAVRLLKLAVNGQADSGFRLFSSDTRLRRLGYTQNNVSIDFAALSFRDEDAVRYRYRLEGLDTGWNAYTDRRYVNYMNLAPGDYRFLVEARNGDGLISREPAAIRFSIAAPFWATAWFLALCILLLVGLAYGFYRYRLHQALAIERLRARISTDLHDDTGSTLSSISILSDMALQEEAARTAKTASNEAKTAAQSPSETTGANGASLTPMLREIRDNSLSLLEKMDDIVWSINPRNDTLESLMLRVKRFAAQLFEARGIDYEIDIEPEIRHLRLLMDHRQNLYLIMKEAINNLVKYAGATKAHIRARHLRHHLVVEISDDGSGFTSEAMATGNGIINMKNRAVGMDADLAIRTAPGEGTTVSLSLKIT